MKRVLLLCTFVFSAFALFSEEIKIISVGNSPQTVMGESFGVPFPKGKYKSSQQFILRNSRAETLPLQQWVMARHGDGSVKWMGFATVLNPENTDELKLIPTNANAIQQIGGIETVENNDFISILNGEMNVTFPKSGNNIISKMEKNGRLVLSAGRLICRTEDRSKALEGVFSYDEYESSIEKVSLEQSGRVRAVVKIEGLHKGIKNNRQWLPFVVRFYFYAGADAISMKHTIIYDGEQKQDFIKGLGIEFNIPFREEIQNRHVRFSGEDSGLWSEPIQPLMGRRVLEYNGDSRIFYHQVNGERVPNKEQFDRKGQYLMDNWAVWNDFSLAQLSPTGFTIRKRTNDQSSWVGTFAGERASGLILAGDVSGGLAVSLKNFWQSYPAELEASSMSQEEGKINIWIWSPKADAMDLRHYDTKGHDLEAAYEDYQEGMSTPYGVGRTSELILYPFTKLPAKEQTIHMAKAGQETFLLMASPEYMHQTKAFGVWSLPDTTHQTKAWIEKQIDGYIHYYQNAIEQHKWYGFWNYGDVMHSYNEARHMWNYDIGGCAWANTELSPDLWLWYAFVRSARPDILKMAMAMTRHTSEVDMYHIGEMAGLGSRHNVSHWGCGAKEARIGQAWWKRFYYYLTTDERMGDLMHEAADADFQMLKWDPLRVAQPREKYPTNQPTRLRWGPDWIAFAGNWFTEWERTGNKKYLEKIQTGMNSLSALPNGLYTGHGPLGYDPKTGKITYEGNPKWITNTNHLANLMGGFEVMMELYDAIDHAKFNQTYLQYAKYYNMPQNDPERLLKKNSKYKNWGGHFNTPRLGAFAAREMKDDHLSELAWNRFFLGAMDKDGNLIDVTSAKQIDTPNALYPLDENSHIGTNGTAQWNLNAIILLELIGDKIPSVEELKNKLKK